MGKTSSVSAKEVGSDGGAIVYNDLLVDLSNAKLPAANAASYESITLRKHHRTSTES